MASCRLVNIITAAFQLPSSAKTLSAQLELHILSTTTAVPVTVSFPPKSKGIRWLGVIWGGRVHVQVPAAGNNVLFAGQPVAFDVQVRLLLLLDAGDCLLVVAVPLQGFFAIAF